jgi:hypothetical protein
MCSLYLSFFTLCVCVGSSFFSLWQQSHTHTVVPVLHVYYIGDGRNSHQDDGYTHTYMSPAGKKDSIVRHRENNPFRSPPNRHLYFLHTHSSSSHANDTKKSVEGEGSCRRWNKRSSDGRHPLFHPTRKESLREIENSKQLRPICAGIHALPAQLAWATFVCSVYTLREMKVNPP